MAAARSSFCLLPELLSALLARQTCSSDSWLSLHPTDATTLMDIAASHPSSSLPLPFPTPWLLFSKQPPRVPA